MPTVPHGPMEGAEYHRVNVTRQPDDSIIIEEKTVDVLRASIGGNEEFGYYLQFRGDPEAVLKMLDIVHETAKHMLPRGTYKDES